MPQPAQHRGKEKVALKRALPDLQEQEAVLAASALLRELSPATRDPDAVTHAVISKWIIERMRMASGARLHETCVFNLHDAKLRGMIEAALPRIGAALDGIDPETPLFALSKDDVVSVFAAGCIGASAAAVSYGESQHFPFDDAIPFGDA